MSDTVSSARDLAIAKQPESRHKVRAADTWVKKALVAFLPHVPVPSSATKAITLIHIAAAIGFWLMIPESTFPGPVSIAQAFRNLWFDNALGRELVTSLALNLRMIALLIPIGILAIVARSLAATGGLVTAVGTFRFLGMSGLTLIFTFYTSGALSLRLSLLVFFVGAYYVTSLARIVDAVPQAKRDYVRTLGMSEWQAMYELDLRGNALEMWEALRQNQAMGWMMLTGVEGLTKSAGGVGTLLLNSQRTWNLAEVYAIQITLWITGLVIDAAFVWARGAFPWFRKGRKGGK
jgi:ABC-type nitrate/sulfonate/bicarbonate transport system permease component